MNTETKFATLCIALVTVVPLLYSGIPCISGGWAIAGFAPALWCFWMGVVIDECRKVKLGVKAAVAVGVIAQIIAFCSVDYARLRLLLSPMATHHRLRHRCPRWHLLSALLFLRRFLYQHPAASFQSDYSRSGLRYRPRY